MNNIKKTILGASGGVGREILAELQKRDDEIRVVERTSKIEGVETFEADLLRKADAIKSLEGSHTVYLCVGLPYSIKVWSQNWPVLMENVIEACEQHGSKLIFLDNIYMYGPPPLTVPFDENHTQQPSSRKGKVRKAVASMMLEAIESGRIKGTIARAPDFFGPFAYNSLLWISFLERMLDGKKAQLLFKPDVPHTYSYTRDIARAMILLGETDDVNGEVFHTPVGKAITLAEAAEIMNSELQTNLSPGVIPGFMKSILSLFMPALREVTEMEYQFKTDYIMSDQKFMTRFPTFEKTSAEEAIRETVRAFKSRQA